MANKPKFHEIDQTVITEPNTSNFLHWVENECYDLIQESIDKDDVKPIVIEMYGRRVELDTHADNYEALTMFLKQVIENEKDD